MLFILPTVYSLSHIFNKILIWINPTECLYCTCISVPGFCWKKSHQQYWNNSVSSSLGLPSTSLISIFSYLLLDLFRTFTIFVMHPYHILSHSQEISLISYFTEKQKSLDVTYVLSENVSMGISLVFQWLGVHTFNVGAQVWSLLRELQVHMPWGSDKKKKCTHI